MRFTKNISYTVKLYISADELTFILKTIVILWQIRFIFQDFLIGWYKNFVCQYMKAILIRIMKNSFLISYKEKDSTWKVSILKSVLDMVFLACSYDVNKGI
jgi:hypothetical protein